MAQAGAYTLEPLLIRADASAAIGTGHVMRCLALAQAWQARGGTAHMVLAGGVPALETRLLAEGVRMHQIAAIPGSTADAEQTAALAQTLGTAWIVVDGYHFHADYMRRLQNGDTHLLVIDDGEHVAEYHADVVLNQNIYAEDSIYAHCGREIQLLLGTRYALLRREFWPWRGWQRPVRQRANRVLVTFGGSDEHNVSGRVMQALGQLDWPGLEITIVVGAANTHRASLEAEAQCSRHTAKLLESVDSMPNLIAWADVVVSAGGSTCWELLFLGSPTVVITLANNQALIARGLHAADAAIDHGWHTQLVLSALAETVGTLLDSPTQRTQLSDKGRTLVDGFGASRVAEVLCARAAICQ